MKAMLLAAGLGQRMGERSLDCPKPLLTIGDSTLIERHLKALQLAGFEDVVINVWYLADQIKNKLGDGSAYGLNIRYSEESERLETGGGIKFALPLLGEHPFLLISSDVLTNMNYGAFRDGLAGDADGHLMLVDNPNHHPQGDFSLIDSRLGLSEQRLTYSGIGVFRAEPFHASKKTVFPLRDVLFPLLQQNRLTGQRWDGYWSDVGTPARLSQAETDIRAGRCPSFN